MPNPLFRVANFANQVEVIQSHKAGVYGFFSELPIRCRLSAADIRCALAWT